MFNFTNIKGRLAFASQNSVLSHNIEPPPLRADQRIQRAEYLLTSFPSILFRNSRGCQVISKKNNLNALSSDKLCTDAKLARIKESERSICCERCLLQKKGWMIKCELSADVSGPLVTRWRHSSKVSEADTCIYKHGQLHIAHIL